MLFIYLRGNKLLWVWPDFVARNPCSEKIILEIGDLMIQFVFELEFVCYKVGLVAGFYI